MLKYSFLLLALLLIVNGTGMLLVSIISTGIRPTDLFYLSLSFFTAPLIAILIFFKGHTREKKSQPQYTLVATTLKFLIEMVIALVWFIVAKKTSLSYILLFFVLYLTFSMFSIWVILNTLKNKSL
jgi:hypothetical protein